MRVNKKRKLEYKYFREPHRNLKIRFEMKKAEPKVSEEKVGDQRGDLANSELECRPITVEHFQEAEKIQPTEGRVFLQRTAQPGPSQDQSYSYVPSSGHLEGDSNINHQQEQKGNKFGCEVCGKHFKQKIHLKRHILWHTGEKPYTCDFCGANFNRKDCCSEHMRKKVCIKGDLHDLEVQVKDQEEYLLNPEVKCHPMAAAEHSEEADNFQSTAIINLQSSQDILFCQQITQPGSSQDPSPSHFLPFERSDGDSNFNYHQGQGYNSFRYQDNRPFDFNSWNSFLNQQTPQYDPNKQTAPRDPMLNRKVAQPVILSNPQTTQHASQLSQKTAQSDPNKQTSHHDPMLNREMAQPVMLSNPQTAQHASQLSQQTAQTNASEDQSFSSSEELKAESTLNHHEEQDLDMQEEYLLNDLLNLELEYYHKASEKPFQEAENVQPTEIINQQSSHDFSFYQQAAQSCPSEDQSFNYFTSFAHLQDCTNINFQQEQGCNNSLYQDHRHFGFNNCHDASNLQTARSDSILNWEMTQLVIPFNPQTALHNSLLSQQTAQRIPSQSQSLFYNPSSRLPEGIRNYSFQQEQEYKFLGPDDTFNFL